MRSSQSLNTDGVRPGAVAPQLSRQRHPGAVCVVSPMGGVGKTTIACLLGYYLARRTRKKVLLEEVPHLDAVARFFMLDPIRSFVDLRRRTPGQPSVHKCVTTLVTKVVQRMEAYRE